jgi:hypothetical protein
MSDYLHWHTFRELDEAGGLTKGNAFRAFKRIEAQLTEHKDYEVLWPQHQREAIEILRTGGRIYASSVNVVLLAPAAEALILKDLQTKSQAEQ